MRSLEKNNPTAYSPSPGISKSVTCCLKNAKGISVIIPAPSPVMPSAADPAPTILVIVVFP